MHDVDGAPASYELQLRCEENTSRMQHGALDTGDDGTLAHLAGRLAAGAQVVHVAACDLHRLAQRISGQQRDVGGGSKRDHRGWEDACA